MGGRTLLTRIGSSRGTISISPNYRKLYMRMFEWKPSTIKKDLHI